jgi:adenylate kinase
MSDLIIKHFDIPHISTGDMLRENVRNNTELGQEAKSYMNSGRLVPDELINAMVEKRLLEDDCQKGYLLDGFPRTLVQAKAFEEMAERIGKPVEAVLALEVGFDTLTDRITGRRICPKCGAIYHVRNHPSQKDGICDACGSELQQRKDDTVEQLKVRLEEYEAKTAPIIGYFEPNGVVTHIDASKNAEATFAQVKEALGKVA